MFLCEEIQQCILLVISRWQSFNYQAGLETASSTPPYHCSCHQAWGFSIFFRLRRTFKFSILSRHPYPRHTQIHFGHSNGFHVNYNLLFLRDFPAIVKWLVWKCRKHIAYYTSLFITKHRLNLKMTVRLTRALKTFHKLIVFDIEWLSNICILVLKYYIVLSLGPCICVWSVS